MSLEKFKINAQVIAPITLIAFINFVLMLIVLTMSVTIFATPSGVELKLPSSNSQGTTARGLEIIISVTSENVIYINDKVVTLNDLRRYLAKESALINGSIFLKADRRSSMGRIGDILDLCRGIPGVKVHVSTIS